MINNHYSYSPSDSQMIGDPFGDNSAMHKDVNHLSISRGERIDAEIDWTKLKTLHVYDEMENKIMFTDIFKHQKTIIIFTRHFLDFVSKEYVEDIAIIPLEYTQNAGVRLVVIGPAQPKHIKAFKKLTGLSYSLYVDPEREVYKALGCQDKIATAAVERDVCHFSHIDQNAADHCPLNDILTRANVMNVSFPKDPRIEIV
ncbi:peroxiredoxin-like 2C isoform X6 [Biomphalaria glabrata]|uniref:Peroxiredoxin-like 2C isoform X6 n=1 Tax=Biomphalaria glabrata TaxID=6526 RepID=A0A9W3AH85_BIOGL|nr:peroxiredoxin-like 2C isoform X6 [Biomphalaria glabrata]